MSAEPVSAAPDGALVRVWVVPGASRSEIAGLHNGRLKVRVAVPPEGGRANREVARLLEERLGCPVELEGGAISRDKVFLARGVDVGTAQGKLTR